MAFARVARTLAGPVAEVHRGGTSSDRQRRLVGPPAAFQIVQNGLVPVTKLRKIVLALADFGLFRIWIVDSDEIDLVNDR